jgi:ParB family protein of integrating conjugative element (PFGI_1 class)
MAAKLLADGFQRTGAEAVVLTDPISDTPMVVTLDELRPYEHNPRVTRNPLYDEIKASIRERGLDAPPAITRRPGEPHFIIRNGGNTRLAILRELWTETKEEGFFRIACLFRPWSARGEIVALTGHLAENELHGSLTFIERALGVEKARELYEQEGGAALTQSELSRRLTADGYPIAQPHISRMRDAVRYLLPALPTVLYAGLGRPQVERLTVLRRAGLRIWEPRAASKRLPVDFTSLFQDVLALFDADTEAFSAKRVQDELIGQMAELLDADYDTLTLELDETEHRQRVIASNPVPQPSATQALSTVTSTSSPAPPSEHTRPQVADTNLAAATEPKDAGLQTDAASGDSSDARGERSPPEGNEDRRLEAHIVSLAPTTERLQSIRRLVADQAGEALPDFATNVLKSVPVQAGGLYPISDVWHIDSGLDAPDRLRIHIAQFAREIANEAGQAERIETVEDGIGFICLAETLRTDARSLPWFPRAVLTLLHALSVPYRSIAAPPAAVDSLRLAETIGPLLQGSKNGGRENAGFLSDSGLVKLFRLLRLARLLLEIEASDAPGNGASSESES